MKKSNKFLMHLLGWSIATTVSTHSFADLVMNPGSGPSQASMSWSAADAEQFLNDDLMEDPEEYAPKGSTKVTTSIRSSNGVVTNNSTSKTVQIFDTSKYSNQPSVNARAALVMDGNTGEVLYSKNSNTALPIASITKLMTAVVISDARLNMSENITLQQADFSCSGCKSSSSSLRAGDSMNRAEALLFALMKSENPASIGGAIRDIKAGKIAEGSVIVCTVTGNGLKDPDTAIKQCSDVVMLSIDATLEQVRDSILSNM